MFADLYKLDILSRSFAKVECEEQ